MPKTIAEINEKINRGAARVVRADEMTKIVRRSGVRRAAEQVDVVTTGTFGPMCSSGVWLNFGHAEPPIKMTRAWLNDVEAYAGVAAVDAYLGAAQPSRRRGIRYGGAHVIEDLLRGKSVVLRAVAYGTDCYPRKKIVGRLTLSDLKTALLSNPRNACQRYVAAVNSSARTLHTYMGKLLPRFGNATYSGAGELSPLANDPQLATVGVGTRIFLGGAQGFVVAAGTQHSPGNRFATLMVQGDLKRMSAEYLRAAAIHAYGTTLYVGLGIPIPILNEQIAECAGVGDAELTTEVLDYGTASRGRPVLGTVSYAELESGAIAIGGRSVPTSALSSRRAALGIAEKLKEWIERGDFKLTAPVEPLSRTAAAGPLDLRPLDADAPAVPPSGPPAGLTVAWDETKCVHCGLCVSYCPRGVFQRDAGGKVSVDFDACRPCGRCRNVCPVQAIRPPRRGGKI